MGGVRGSHGADISVRLAVKLLVVNQWLAESHSDTKPEEVWQFRATAAVLLLVNGFMYFCLRDNCRGQFDSFTDVKNIAKCPQWRGNIQWLHGQHEAAWSCKFEIYLHWPTANMFELQNYEWLLLFFFSLIVNRSYVSITVRSWNSLWIPCLLVRCYR